jgi:hypothetical protein
VALRLSYSTITDPVIVMMSSFVSIETSPPANAMVPSGLKIACASLQRRTVPCGGGGGSGGTTGAPTSSGGSGATVGLSTTGCVRSRAPAASFTR